VLQHLDRLFYLAMYVIIFQMTMLRQLLNDDREPLVDNFRQLQPLNGRTVLSGISDSILPPVLIDTNVFGRAASVSGQLPT
jgi:hypothetical protein